MLKNYFVVCLIAVSIFFDVHAASGLVKKSKSGICHSQESSYYNRTKNFTAFDSLESCINSGGRLPKGFVAKGDVAAQSASHLKHYTRSQFGSGWSDVDRDCQNSRMEVLVAQSVGPVHFKDSRECSVRSGKWISSFTGETLYEASSIDIDHVIPLKWAWDHGASSWSYEQRVAFANDPANLLSVEASLNRSKGAKGLDEWLPPKNQCQYIARFIRVMKKYPLNVGSKKLDSITSLKNSYCA
ncbi:HNH endonuclease family protein [Thalassotalea nanhaiensis]|uniref:HNH endonuclease family protein n=1 Tax=Thalassotalea nanhaiensis TaxID=3065648 RepID=A0ABY9TMV9_9GAMM|nr:HNH endonuclease family protein [Colwelliaceae bacterium SQ345]